MKCLSLLVLLILPLAAFAQEKTNEDITRQIRQLGVDKITLTFDQPSNMSKVMAVSENFSNREADAAGVQAINFAMAFFYPGTSLKRSPETIHFAFWVLTKKPRFAEDHHLTVELDGRTLDLGDARYAAKPRQNLEYLNFELKRTDLAAIGAANSATFRIGQRAFLLTRDQQSVIRGFVSVTDG